MATRSYRYLRLDVFTDRLFGGNPLAVFPDGRGLSEAAMQAIAKEMNLSESTFVLPAERGDTDMRVRIFTPGEELPMAGHPTIGTAFALARSGVLAPGRAAVTFGLGVGPTHVDLSWRDGALAFARMTQLPPTWSAPVPTRASLASALGLIEDDLVPHLPVQVVSCGVPYVLVALKSRTIVDAARLDTAGYERFRRDQALGASVCVFIFTTERADADRATAYCRMFGPGVGILEDPATGSAAGPLGCYLVEQGLVAPNHATEILARQGVRMGRPSDIHVAIETAGRRVSSVRVGGGAVLAGEGILYVS